MKKVISVCSVFILLLTASLSILAQETTAKNAQATEASAPGRSKDYYQIGLAHYQSKDFKAAIDAFKRALRAKPNDATIYYQMGMAYYSSNLYRDASEAFKQAVRLKPDWPDAHFRLGWMDYVLGRIGDSQEQYKILQQLNPEQANTLYRIIKADVAKSTKQPPAAASDAKVAPKEAATADDPKVESKLVVNESNPPPQLIPNTVPDKETSDAGTAETTNANTTNVASLTPTNNTAPASSNPTNSVNTAPTSSTVKANAASSVTTQPAKEAPPNNGTASTSNAGVASVTDTTPAKSNTASKTPDSLPKASDSTPKANDSTAKAVDASGATDEASLVNTYRVGPGDVLDIRLLNTPNIRSTLYTVMDGGLIEYPLAGGPVIVTGLTTDEINARLLAELKRRAVNDAKQEVMVSVREYTSHTIVINGLVNSPGIRILHREAIPLYVALAEAQPHMDAGRAVIMRASGQILVDLSDPAQMNMLVRPGDVITVQLRPPQFYYMGGKITTPGQKVFQPGITLMQAILAAGGLERSTEDNIQISREGADGRLTTARFKLREIKAGKVPDPRLQPGDRIEVGR